MSDLKPGTYAVFETSAGKMTCKLFKDQAASLSNLVERHQKPLVGFTFQSLENPFIQKLLEHGLAVLPSPERAARAMAALAGYSRFVCRQASSPSSFRFRRATAP